jgi:sRNA-binding protein
MDEGAKDRLAGSPGETGGELDAQKDLHSRTGRDETKRKTQERMERRSTLRKRSSSAGSQKMERAGDR